LYIEHDTDIEIDITGPSVSELNIRFTDNRDPYVEFDMLSTGSIDKALIRYSASFNLNMAQEWPLR
ncbi:hypothetical protein LTR49_028215, partial [Elasticomyces elasticus]